MNEIYNCQRIVRNGGVDRVDESQRLACGGLAIAISESAGGILVSHHHLHVKSMWPSFYPDGDACLVAEPGTMNRSSLTRVVELN